MRTKTGPASIDFHKKPPAASKPFMTEYKLAYKDPTPFTRKGGNVATTGKSKKAASTSSVRATSQSVKPQAAAPTVALPKIEAQSQPTQIVVVRPGKGKSKKDLWNPPPVESGTESTSLTLPGMLNTHHQVQMHFRRRRILGGVASIGHQHMERYNIISGSLIEGEPHSGYKEGRRAVIPSFVHIDSTTNARTPGYNIISNKDYLLDESLIHAAA